MFRKLYILLLLCFVLSNAYGYVITSLPYNISSNGVYWINTTLYCNNKNYCFYINSSTVTNVTIISNGSGKIYLNYSKVLSYYIGTIKVNEIYYPMSIFYGYNNITIRMKNLKVFIQKFPSNNTTNLNIRGNLITRMVACLNNCSLMLNNDRFIYLGKNRTIHINDSYIPLSHLLINGTTFKNMSIDLISNDIEINNSLFDNVLLITGYISMPTVSEWYDIFYHPSVGIKFLNNTRFVNSTVFLYFPYVKRIYVLNSSQSLVNLSKYIENSIGMNNVSSNGGYIFLKFMPLININVIYSNKYLKNISVVGNKTMFFIKNCNLTNVSALVYGPISINNTNAILYYLHNYYGFSTYLLFSGFEPKLYLTEMIPIYKINLSMTINISGKMNVTISKYYASNNTSIYNGYKYVNFSSIINNSWIPISLNNSTIYLFSRPTKIYYTIGNNTSVIFGYSVNSRFLILNEGNKTTGVSLYMNLQKSKNTNVYIYNTSVNKIRLFNVSNVYSYNSSFINIVLKSNESLFNFSDITLPYVRAYNYSINSFNVTIENSKVSMNLDTGQNITSTEIISKNFTMTNCSVNIYLIDSNWVPWKVYLSVYFDNSSSRFVLDKSRINLFLTIFNNTKNEINFTMFNVNNSNVTMCFDNVQEFFNYGVPNNTTNVYNVFNLTKLNIYLFNISNSKIYIIGLNNTKWVNVVPTINTINESYYDKFIGFLFNLTSVKNILTLNKDTANISCSRLCDANRSIYSNSNYYLWYSFYVNIDPSFVVNWPDGNEVCPKTLSYINGRYVFLFKYPYCPFTRPVVNNTTVSNNTVQVILPKKKKKQKVVVYVHKNMDVYTSGDISKIGVGFNFKLLLLFLIFFISIVLIVLGYLTSKKK